MDIEYEAKDVKKDDILEDGEKNQRMRGRKKKQKQVWEETIEVILPLNLKEVHKTDKEQTVKEQKGKYKKKQSAEMEIEEQNSSSSNYKDVVKQIQQKQGHYKTIFELNEYYQTIIDHERFNIQRDNFVNLISEVFKIIKYKMVENPNFLNYIQLLIEKSHLDMLKEFNKQLEFDIKMKHKNQIHLIKYDGSNQLYKILTHFKQGIDTLIESKEKDDQEDQKEDYKKETILCLFDGAYSISKQDMVDIGKFLFEDYEHFSDRYQITIIIPINFQSPIADVQIYSIEFCKSQDLFVKLLLSLLKKEEFPPLPLELLKSMLSEFDLYQITYNEQVRRIQLAITNFLYTHQHESDLIEVLLYMKENAQARLLGYSENQMLDEEIKEDQSEVKYDKRKSTTKNNIKKTKQEEQNSKMSQNKKQKLIGKVDFYMKNIEIKAIISFLEKLYSCNFSTIEENDENPFSQSVIDQNHRIIQLALSKDKSYIMPQQQQKEFIKNPDPVCEFIKNKLKQEQDEGGQNSNFFGTYINQLEYLEESIQQDQERKKKLALQKNVDRNQQLQMMKNQKTQSAMTPEEKATLKKEKVEDIVKQIITQFHQNFIVMKIPQLEIDINSLDLQFRPDMLGRMFNQLKKEQPGQPKTNSTKQLDSSTNTDGMNLLYLIQEQGRSINIQESFSEYKGFMVEKKIMSEKEAIQSSFYNAVCELRYLGLMGEKGKLKSQLVKHFFAKTSYFPFCKENNN